MASARQVVFGSALLLGGIRLTFVLMRAVSPPTPPALIPMDPEAVSQREAQKGEARARLAQHLDASVLDLEAREALDLARGDASRSLRDLGREANAAGLGALGFQAFELDRALLHDARTTCSLDALRKLDAASSDLSPAARAPLAERLAIVHRHVKRTCELATL
ncbi:MAG: hypothetical protein JWP87_6147 [Labilithrix sp.]|jgi:hypothetical protein|nr:hypothetical protein [Labilithrix sp.]